MRNNRWTSFNLTGHVWLFSSLTPLSISVLKNKRVLSCFWWKMLAFAIIWKWESLVLFYYAKNKSITNFDKDISFKYLQDNNHIRIWPYDGCFFIMHSMQKSNAKYISAKNIIIQRLSYDHVVSEAVNCITVQMHCIRSAIMFVYTPWHCSHCYAISLYFAVDVQYGFMHN